MATNPYTPLPIDKHDFDMSTSATSSRDLACEAICAVDLLMRDHYAKTKSRLMEHLDPVIVVQFSFTGGIYTLIHNGVRETVSPVGKNFELCKSISHIPLGIYSLIAPYLKYAPPVGWQNGITNFKNVITNARTHLKAAALPQDAEKACRTIIDASVAYLDAALKTTGSFDEKIFKKYTSKIQGEIYINMKTAVRAQIDGVIPLLVRWRKQLGSQWKDLYAVTMAIWTTQERNQNWLLLRHMMDPATVDSHLITISTAAPEENTVPIALENLARIVHDKIAASMVFSAPIKFSHDSATALIGPVDFLAQTIEDMLKTTPHLAKEIASWSGGSTSTPVV